MNVSTKMRTILTRKAKWYPNTFGFLVLHEYTRLGVEGPDITAYYLCASEEQAKMLCAALK